MQEKKRNYFLEKCIYLQEQTIKRIFKSTEQKKLSYALLLCSLRIGSTRVMFVYIAVSQKR